MSTPITIEDFFREEEWEDWRKTHPLGPVHVQIRCLCCDAILFTDLRGFGWLEDRSFVESKLVPHVIEHSSAQMESSK